MLMEGKIGQPHANERSGQTRLTPLVRRIPIVFRALFRFQPFPVLIGFDDGPVLCNVT